VDWSVTSARLAFAEYRLQDWIEQYLQVPDWANPGLLRRVRAFSVEWPAPELVVLDRFDLIAGPGPDFHFPKDPAVWEREVAAIVARGISVESLPPLIGWAKEDGRLNLADGNHRVAAAERAGIGQLWALVHPTPLSD
jgi:hypothetical protein